MKRRFFEKILFFLIVIQILCFLFEGDIFWLKRQLKYQYSYRVEVEKENDCLKKRISMCLNFKDEPLKFSQKRENFFEGKSVFESIMESSKICGYTVDNYKKYFGNISEIRKVYQQ